MQRKNKQLNHQTHLAFHITPSESKGSIEKVASSYSLETNIKVESFETYTKLYSLNISACEQNIVKILKIARNYKLYWYNTQSN